MHGATLLPRCYVLSYAPRFIYSGGSTTLARAPRTTSASASPPRPKAVAAAFTPAPPSVL
eukprot:scaffold112603_cov63-Phaeocystis_antarctica.AAC.2